MSYEVEHSLPTKPQPTTRPRRPDLSTFFSNLNLVDTSHTNNPHATPTPADVSAVFRTLAEAFERMRQDGSAGGSGGGSGGGRVGGGGYEELMESLVEYLMDEAAEPPKEVEGVGEEFLASLDRIPKSRLKKSDTCPICNNPFLEDKYPLVVRLPCHKTHVFDLECIEPWLRLHSTCPLDRKVLVKKKEVKKKEEMPEELDDMYA